MTTTGNDDARDSRDWPLPPYLEQVEDGVRLRLREVPWNKILPAAVIWAVIAVLYGRISAFGPTVVGATGGSVLLAVAPFVVVWARRREDAVSAADLRLAARYGMGVVVALTGVAFVAAAIASVLDIAAGQLFAPGAGAYRMVACFATFSVVTGAWLTGLTLRAARRVDPATPPAVLPRDRSLRPRWYTVDYGEAGARFPNILPAAFAAPVAAAAWLSVVLGNLGYHHGDTITLVAMGGALGLVPLMAGVAWWPWLPAAVTRGLRPGQLRAVGLTSLIGGAAGGSGSAAALLVLTAAEPGGANNALFGLAGLLAVGGVLGVLGGQLIAFGARLRRAGLHPAEVPAGR